MLILFWVIFILVVVLCFQNGRYAVKQYLSNRQYMIFTFYMVLLIAFGTTVLHLTTKVFETVQAVHDIDSQPQ